MTSPREFHSSFIGPRPMFCRALHPVVINSVFIVGPGWVTRPALHEPGQTVESGTGSADGGTGATFPRRWNRRWIRGLWPVALLIVHSALCTLFRWLFRAYFSSLEAGKMSTASGEGVVKLFYFLLGRQMHAASTVTAVTTVNRPRSFSLVVHRLCGIKLVHEVLLQ